MTIVENKRERGRPRAFDRNAVLERAMRVFWASGYEGASMPMLTDAMGISAQSLYAAFGSKEALYREAMELYRTTLGAFPIRAIEEEVDALDSIARLLRESAFNFADAQARGCMITTAPAGVTEDPLILFGRELRAEGVQNVAERLQRGIAEGQIRPGTDCSAWARYVGCVVHGLSVQARDGASAEALLTSADIAGQAMASLRK